MQNTRSAVRLSCLQSDSLHPQMHRNTVCYAICVSTVTSNDWNAAAASLMLCVQGLDTGS
jgi:hypothetical protein